MLILYFIFICKILNLTDIYVYIKSCILKEQMDKKELEKVIYEMKSWKNGAKKVCINAVDI